MRQSPSELSRRTNFSDTRTSVSVHVRITRRITEFREIRGKATRIRSGIMGSLPLMTDLLGGLRELRPRLRRTIGLKHNSLIDSLLALCNTLYIPVDCSCIQYTCRCCLWRRSTIQRLFAFLCHTLHRFTIELFKTMVETQKTSSRKQAPGMLTQNQLPLGTSLSPVHARWNHSRTQFSLSQPIISPWLGPLQ